MRRDSRNQRVQQQIQQIISLTSEVDTTCHIQQLLAQLLAISIAGHGHLPSNPLAIGPVFSTRETYNANSGLPEAHGSAEKWSQYVSIIYLDTSTMGKLP